MFFDLFHFFFFLLGQHYNISMHKKIGTWLENKNKQQNIKMIIPKTAVAPFLNIATFVSMRRKC